MPTVRRGIIAPNGLQVSQTVCAAAQAWRPKWGNTLF